MIYFAGIQRLTLLDYPGHTACIVFLPGCNFRCHYCHNSEFVLPEKLEKIRNTFIPESVFFQFLKKRVGKLEGVVISGGEPTIHQNLPIFLRKIKKMGFLIKLDTNGSHPEMLKTLVDEKLLDYIAMDIKASPTRYEEFSGISFENTEEPFLVQKSRDILFHSSVPYEIRTTLVQEFHDEQEFIRLCTFVKGSQKWVLQNFRSTGGCLNPDWEKFSGFSQEKLETMKKKAEKMGILAEIRI